MRKKILATIGIPVLLAGSALAGGASFKAPQKPKPAPVPSDFFVFHGELILLPSADNPTKYVINQALPVLNNSSCSISSDPFFNPPKGEGNIPCQMTSHGSASLKNGVLHLSGTTVVTSNDGTQKFTGTFPTGGSSKTVTKVTGSETDADGSVSTLVSLSGSATIDTKSMPGTTLIDGGPGIVMFEARSAADQDQ